MLTAAPVLCDRVHAQTCLSDQLPRKDVGWGTNTFSASQSFCCFQSSTIHFRREKPAKWNSPPTRPPRTSPHTITNGSTPCSHPLLEKGSGHSSSRAVRRLLRPQDEQSRMNNRRKQLRDAGYGISFESYLGGGISFESFMTRTFPAQLVVEISTVKLIEALTNYSHTAI